ncbi:hypothetical protein ACHWQZ_G014911 [Mnemiopsis leidyi]
MSPMTSSKRSLPEDISPKSKTILTIPAGSPSGSLERSPKRVCRLSPPSNRGKSYVSNLKIAVVCSSNQNRSMEAHNLLQKRGYRVQSFGTGSCVKLPGVTVDKPNIYSFDTPYQDQFVDLKRKDASFYTQNGLLNMLDRNRRIKQKPERFQENKDEFDLIVTCQERVFDQVLENLSERGGNSCKMVHVINVEIKDNHDDATLGAFIIHELVKEICLSSDHEAELEEIINTMEKKKKQRFLYSPSFY